MSIQRTLNKIIKKVYEDRLYRQAQIPPGLDDEIKDRFADLQPLSQKHESEAGKIWANNRQRIRDLVNEGSLRDFLDWDVVKSIEIHAI